jgi:hypothetical protein
MKRILFPILAAFAVTLFADKVLGEEGNKGRQRLPAAQGKSAQDSGIDVPAERFGFLHGKTLKPGFEQPRKAPIKSPKVETSGLLGIQRRVPQQYPTIQAGITAAVHGDTVLVSEGTYFENIDFSGKRIIVASLYLLDRDTSHIPRTIIDGSQATSPQSVVSFLSGEDTNSILCGFTVRGGAGTDIPPAFDERDGGGVILWESSGRLVRNIITGNRVYAPNAWGGGVSMTGLTNTGKILIMEDNIVSRNIVTATTGGGNGGGVSIYQSQFRLTGNVFEYDSARGVVQAAASGVWVYFSNGSTAIHANLFRSNFVLSDSLSGGCLILVNTGMVVVDDNIFEDNVATSMYTSAVGGGLVMQEEGATFPKKTVTRNIFRRNRVNGTNRYAYAGAIWNAGANADITENLVQDNRAEAALSYQGGGIYGVSWGGTIANNIVTGNSARTGGGIGHTGVPPSGVTQVVVNNTLSDNVAEFGGGFYGGTNTTSILLNNILWDDSSSTGEIYAASSGTIEAHYSNIEGGWISGTGNINVNPMFADTLYRLANSSPCIGAGRDSMQIAGTWYRSPTRDFGGNPRPDPAPSQPDMGAWENPRGTPTNVGDGQEGLPTAFELAQNYPNPFNPSTTITYTLSSQERAGVRSQVTLKVYDLLGREIATLVNEEKPAGAYSVSWDATGMAGGVYFYRIQTRDFAQTKRLIFLK